MADSLPTLEINVYDGHVSAVASLVSTTKGVVEISTDARWCDKAAVFAAVAQHVALAAKGHPSVLSKTVGTRVDVKAFAQGLLDGQEAGKLTFVRVWSEGYRESVDKLGAPVTDMHKIVR